MLLAGALALGATGAATGAAAPSGAAPLAASDAVRGASPDGAVAPSGAVQALTADLEGVLEGVGEGGTWSVLAVSLDQGDTLFSHEAHTPLAPASNVKLISSAVALRHLGPDFRFQTFVLGTGPIENGVLRGDLILYGTGDPSISDRFFESRDEVFVGLARSLREAGIREVEGDLVGDESYFEGPRRAAGWDTLDLNDWFAAPVSALSYNENVFTLRVGPGESSGAPARIRTLPVEAGVPVSNLARTGAGGRIQIRREDPSRPVRIEGGIAAGAREVWRQMTVQDPARFTTSAFRRVLASEGVVVRGGARLVRDASGSEISGRTVHAPGIRGEDRLRVLARHRSPPLSELLDVVNKRSHNLYAELLLLATGRVVEGDGSFRGGTRVAARFLAEEVGIAADDVHLEDGSGLSGDNRVSAATFVALLDHMTSSPLWGAFWASLPEAGNPRELRRMYDGPAAGNLRAKTGTIEHASALSGLVRSGNGEWIAFSILANDLGRSTARAKGIENRIGSRLAEFQRPFERRRDGTRLAAAEEPDEVGAAEEGAEGERLAAEDAETTVAAEDDAETAAGDVRRHRVQPGENFTVIARTYGVSLNALMDANPDVSPRSLRAGEWIEIPPPSGDGGEER